ncbi:FAD-dependent oxidoreductase [Crossiella sp. CA-258035]|uniref:FAD-dependent oxidoreductase n=1 Tax=Crossiella sp. CA-258035 TaxID=2981138 RepID=UPI0024BD2DE1|nr:FAD-dependent oxidoreductase [Crossiella sp. CA-258035]WHT15770.1 FAD-dependent oxidoreductase [Crossiella sp. CA-258035]
MLPVLIAGAGPTGLTLAIDLARRNIPFRLVDAATEPFAGSRGKGIQPRTQEVFEDLGVLARLLAHGGPYPQMRAYRGTEVLGDHRLFEPREATDAVPYPNGLMSPQWRTESLLRERLAELGGAVEFGTPLTGFTQDADGVNATVGGHTVRASYLVGADGGRSFVRKTLGVDFLGETIETQQMLVGDLRLTGLDRDFWHAWPGGSGPLALCPLAGTDTFQLIAPPPDGVELPTLAGLQELVTAATGRADLRLTELIWLSRYRANVRMVDRYRVGRVFLAGDAAHVHSPAGGQGLNTGVQDAYNLGWKLAAVLSGEPDELLETYQAERLPVAADVLGLSSRLVERDAAEGIRRGKETDQLDISYRGGPLAPAGWQSATGLAAGDRAPDARLADGRRLFELFRGPHWTRLEFGTTSATPELTSQNVRTVVITEESVRASYGVPEGAVALVRPDGYLGAIEVSARAAHTVG